MQNKVLKDEVSAIIEEKSKEEIERLRRHFEVHSMNVIEVSLEEILSRERIIRVFKKRDSKNKNQDIRNMLTEIVK